MKNILKAIAVALLGATVFASCQKPEPVDTTTLEVTPASCNLSATPPAKANLTVTCNASWTASTEASWLTLSATSGEGNATVSVSAALNSGEDGQAAEARSAEVVFTAGKKSVSVTVNQKAETIVFEVSGKAEVPADGGKVVINVEHNLSYTLTIPEDAKSWISQDETKAVVTDVLNFTVAANETVFSRNAELEVKASNGSVRTVKVSQAGQELVFNVAEVGVIEAAAHTLKIAVEHNCGFTVEVPSETTWIKKVETKAVTAAKDTVAFEVEANEDATSRETSITFTPEAGNAKVLTISQMGKDELKEIANLDDWKKFVEQAENLTEDRVITITADLDFSGYTHTSIPKFYATLDGNGHCIKNWEILGSQPLINGLYGTVKNLVIAGNCPFTFDSSVTDNSIICKAANKGSHVVGCVNYACGSVDATDGTYASIRFGFVAAYGGGYIENCKNYGDFTMKYKAKADGVNSCNYVGGIIGYYSTPSEIGEATPNLKGCVNSGNLSLEFDATPNKGGFGGIAGATATSGKLGSLTDKGWIVNCDNYGAVTFTAEYGGSGIFNVGGVIGFVEGHVKGCNNYGNVTYTGSKNKTVATTRPAVGGVAGAVCYTIEDCTNCGNVYLQGTFVSTSTIYDTSTDQNNQLVCRWYGPSIGGVVAQVGNLNAAGDSYIKGCCNTGKVKFDTDMLSSAGTSMCAGGVLGFTNKPVTNCNNEGEITFVSLMSGICGGGILGYADSDDASLTKCINIGKISVCNNLTAANGNQARYFWVGGVVGDINSTKQANKSAKITITDCENTADLTVVGGYMQASYSYLGGVIGRGYYELVAVTNCKNSGNLSSELPLKFRTGGVAGNLWAATMDNCRNTGNLNYPNAFSKSCIGGFIGHGTPKAVTGCSSLCKVEATNAADSAYVSLFTGSVGNTTITWDDITVGGTLAASSVARAGILLGGQIDVSAEKSTNASLTIGATKPCYVLTGTTYNGTEILAADLADLSKLISWRYPTTVDRITVADGAISMK